jgi:hypothetical protein
MKIIGISGKAGSGKDTAYQVYAEHLAEQGFKCTKLSFAGKLKDSCTLMFGWDRDRLDYDIDYKEGDTLDDGSPDPACELLGKTRRVVMQELGTDAMRRGLHPDIWIITQKLAMMNGEYDDYDYVFITDARFLNELNFVVDLGGITVQVQRTGDSATLTGETQHISELEWTQWDEWDAVVENEIIPELSVENNKALLQNTMVHHIDRAFARQSLMNG